jgi:hypothetical protein
MLFYQFIVARELNEDEQADARLMVRVDDDVERSTETAVHFLRDLGWVVKEVRHAQLAESMDEFSRDGSALRLYRAADREGLACVVDGIDFSSALASEPVGLGR